MQHHLKDARATEQTATFFTPVIRNDEQLLCNKMPRKKGKDGWKMFNILSGLYELHMNRRIVLIYMHTEFPLCNTRLLYGMVVSIRRYDYWSFGYI